MTIINLPSAAMSDKEQEVQIIAIKDDVIVKGEGVFIVLQKGNSATFISEPLPKEEQVINLTLYKWRMK